jgi:hypothetical protein
LARDFGISKRARVGMGGYGSGRWGGRPTVESGLTLDLSRLLKSGWLKARASTAGTLRWSAAGIEMASVDFESCLGEKTGHMHLRWTSTDLPTGEKRGCENRITLTTRPQPFGGRRWWFICPHTGRLASRLHLPSGAYTFACRRAYRMGYRSQRQTLRDRALSRAYALRQKLGNHGLIGSYVAKPKGMHWRTFERLVMRIERAEGIVQGHASRLLFLS